jgi:hypothetical protein
LNGFIDIKQTGDNDDDDGVFLGLHRRVFALDGGAIIETE